MHVRWFRFDICLPVLAVVLFGLIYLAQYYVAQREDQAWLDGFYMSVKYLECLQLEGTETWPGSSEHLLAMLHRRGQFRMPLPDCDALRQLLAGENH